MNKNVLIAHVPYRVRGGEDIHIEQLQLAYKNIGITPLLLPRVLRESDNNNILQRSLYSLQPSTSFSILDDFLQKEKIDFIHINNLFPNLGPRFLRWVEDKKIPTVMTLHNHRFFCTNGLAMRDGQPCRDCVHSKVPWRPILYNCNGSYSKSIYHSLAMAEIRQQNLLDKAVRTFIAPSTYIGDEIMRQGVHPNKVRLIMHPTASWSTKPPTPGQPKYDVIYAGRISQEKGIRVLLDAIDLLPDLKFLILGSGSAELELERAIHEKKNLEYRVAETHDNVLRYISNTKIGVLPSVCNEILSLFALEVFFQGKYCVLSDSISMRWLAATGMPGKFARMGDAVDLARVIQEAIQNPILPPSDVEKIQEQLGMNRFEKELASMVESLL